MRIFFVLMTVIFLTFYTSCNKNKNPVKIIEPEPVTFIVIDQYPAWSPVGNIMVYYHQQKFYQDGTPVDSLVSGLYTIKPDGSDNRLLFEGIFFSGIDWSPDGKWIVFSQNSQIYKMKINTDSLTQLTFENENFFSSWSPDGKWITYDSNKDSPNGMNFIWKINIDGSNQKRICYKPGIGEMRMPNISPDGQRIVHQRYVGVNAPEIFIMDINGENHKRLTNDTNGDSYPVFSPTGKYICFKSQPYASVPQLAIIDSSGNNFQFLTKYGSGASADWSPDNAQIVFTNASDGRLWIISVSTKEMKPLTFNPIN